jgi:hypothetical protein
MKAHVLRGSKQQIAESVARLDGEVVEAVVFVMEPAAAVAALTGEDIFAEMDPFMAQASDPDYSRESIYGHMKGE